MMRTATSGFLRSISSNREPLMATTRTSVRATASAVRGMASSRAISPKKSPFSRRERLCDSPAMCLMMSTSPSWMMNISVPRSPWEKIFSPAEKVS
jgi:hypothetical protein